MSSEFFIPDTIQKAIKIKEETKKTFFLGGGTMLNSWTKNTGSKNLICLKLLNLKNIARKNGYIYIDSGVTMTEMTKSPILAYNLPLGEIVRSCHIVSKNIRNMATVGGIIASRYTRSDFIPLFLVLDAEILYEAPDGEHLDPIDEYYENPPSKTMLIKQLVLKESNEPFFFKTKRYARSSNDLPIIKVAVFFRPEGVAIKNLRIAVGGLYEKPMRLYELEKLLEGKDYTDTDFRKVIKDKLNEMPKARNDFRGSSDFRKELTASFLEDILTSAVKGDVVE
ncbi:FAD binding domain-containing protein [bacterium]|nr:FAD binding domain-containing protein [bacterium]